MPQKHKQNVTTFKILVRKYIQRLLRIYHVDEHKQQTTDCRIRNRRIVPQQNRKVAQIQDCHMKPVPTKKHEIPSVIYVN